MRRRKGAGLFAGDPFPRMCELVPEGASGHARVEHFTVTEEESRRTAIWSFGARRDEFVDAGKYARLVFGRDTIVMSDTRMERLSNMEVYRRARGRVLLGGLGLGMLIHAIVSKPEVSGVVVIEKSPDVIRLVEPSLPRRRSAPVEVLEADVFSWDVRTGRRGFDTLYFDIWSEISTDSLDAMGRLHRRFAGCKASSAAWMGSWQRDALLDRRRRERREDWYEDVLARRRRMAE